MLSRRGIIASPILRPVVEVLVGPGDRVTKGRRDQALRSRAAGQGPGTGERLQKYRGQGPANPPQPRPGGEIPEHRRAPRDRLQRDLATALSNEAQAQAAAAELALAQSELKLYTVTASIDGEITWLDVSPGTVTWPGSLIWGEIVDLRELDVRCEVSPVEAEQFALGQSAEVWLDGKAEATATGKVVLIGKAADRNTGFIPVVVRVANPQERFRRGCRESPVRGRKGEMIAGSPVARQTSYQRGLAGWPGPGKPGPVNPAGGRPGPRRPEGAAIEGSRSDTNAPWLHPPDRIRCRRELPDAKWELSLISLHRDAWMRVVVTDMTCQVIGNQQVRPADHRAAGGWARGGWASFRLAGEQVPLWLQRGCQGLVQVLAMVRPISHVSFEPAVNLRSVRRPVPRGPRDQARGPCRRGQESDTTEDRGRRIRLSPGGARGSSRVLFDQATGRRCKFNL